MHEWSIVESLIGILERKAAEHGVRRVVAVRMRLGRLRGLDARQIRGCFELLRDGTVADGAALAIADIPAELRCRACGLTWEPPRWQLVCPACAAADAEVTKGRELEIESFDAERGG